MSFTCENCRHCSSPSRRSCVLALGKKVRIFGSEIGKCGWKEMRFLGEVRPGKSDFGISETGVSETGEVRFLGKVRLRVRLGK
jgi:hypothetical protein